MNLKHRINTTFLRRSLSCLALAIGGVTVASAAVTWKNIQFGGFISQGYMESTNNNYPVETKGGTFDFREYAVNASTTFGTHLRVGAQIFGQTFGEYGDDKPVLDWALVDYNFVPEFGVKVGRLKFPRSLYSDVIDLDIVRPFIFLPQTIYDSRLRDFQSSFDGAMLYGNVGVGQVGSFDYKVFYGDIPMKTDSGAADYFNTRPIYANPPGLTSLGMDSVRGAALNWNTPVAGLRIGASYSYYANLVGTGSFIAVPSYSANITLLKALYEGVSVEYTRGPWTFAGEYLVNKIEGLVTLPRFIAPPMTHKAYNRNYYLSVARRLGTKFEVGTYFTATRESYPAVGTIASARYRRDWALAVRYDVNDHLLFKIEAHAINGTMDMFNVPGISNSPGSKKSSMLLFAAKTTLSF